MGIRAKTTRKADMLLQVLIMVGILAVMNYLSARYFARLDFTADREYTLAPETRGLLENLDDIINIDVYISRNIPPYLVNLKGQIRDILDEYRAYAGHNLRLQFIYPENDPATQQKMRMLGIPQIQLNILERDQFQLTNLYLGLVVLFEDRKEVIPFIQDTSQLEYQLSSAILKVTRKVPLRVAIAHVDSMVNPQRSSRYSLMEKELSRQYVLLPFSFGHGGGPVPEDVDTLVVTGPQNMDERSLFYLDQFVARGGKLLLMIDTIDLPQGSLMPQKVDHGLGDLLKAWGLAIDPEVVVDPDYNAPVSFSDGFIRFRVPYAYWPRVTLEGFDRTQPIVSHMESLVMPWTSPLEVPAEPPPDLEYTILARSSDSSWVEGEPFDFNPRRRPQFREGSGEGYHLAILVSGLFRSLFADSQLPEGLTEEEQGGLLRAGPQTSVLVVGNSRFAMDDFVSQFPENGLFFMNAVDWMALGSDLIGVRSRGVTERPLPSLSEKVKTSFRYANIFGVALLVLLVGLARLYIRRKAVPRGF